MQEIHDMLNRMDYLATQSANGTYQDDVDREALQKEVTALKAEINRIAESANFNGIQLLNGDLDNGSSAASGLTDVNVTAEVDGIKASEDPRKVFTPSTRRASSPVLAPPLRRLASKSQLVVRRLVP